MIKVGKIYKKKKPTHRQKKYKEPKIKLQKTLKFRYGILGISTEIETHFIHYHMTEN